MGDEGHVAQIVANAAAGNEAVVEEIVRAATVSGNGDIVVQKEVWRGRKGNRGSTVVVGGGEADEEVLSHDDVRLLSGQKRSGCLPRQPVHRVAQLLRTAGKR